MIQEKQQTLSWSSKKTIAAMTEGN